MSRFGKIATGTLLSASIALTGCRPSRGTANPEDYFPLIQVALAGGETAAMIGRNEALKAKSFDQCVAAESLVSAFGSAQEVLAGRLQGKIVVPAVDIDVSECLAARDPDVEAYRGNPDAAVLVETIAGITVAAVQHYAMRLKGTSCKKGVAALGAVSYVKGVVKPVADEIAKPDGKVSVPSQVIDLSECGE